MGVLLFGLGGMGSRALLRVKKRLESSEELKHLINREIYFGVIDIETESGVASLGTKIEDKVELKVENPKDVIQTDWNEDESFREWWIRKPNGEPWIDEEEISGTSGAMRKRRCGRMAFYYNFQEIKRFVESQINRTQLLQLIGKQPSINEFIIFVVSSLGGGTGSGIFIDFVALLRDIVGGSVHILGVLIDGTITSHEEFQAPGSDKVAMAALTELERWNANPSEFKMKYRNGMIPSESSSLTRFFDGVFIIQYNNKKGKHRRASNYGEEYEELVAEFLYTFAIMEREMLKDIIANHLSRLKDLQTYEGRAVNYGSFSVSSFVFPYEEIANSLIWKWIEETKIKEQGLEKADLPDLSRELDVESIRMSIRNQANYNLILQKINETERQIKRAERKKVIDTIENVGWNDIGARKSEIEGYIEEFNKVMKNILEGKKNRIKEIIRNRIPTLDFREINNSLTNLIEKLNNFRESLTSTGVSQSGSFPLQKDELNKKLENLKEEIKKSGWRWWKWWIWKKKRDEYVKAFRKELENFIQDEENRKLGQFYLDLSEYLKNLSDIVNKLESDFGGALSSFRQMESQQPPENIDVGDVPFQVKIRTRRIEEECYNRIQKPDINQIKESFRNGITIDNTKIKGVLEIFDELHKTQGGDYKNNFEEIFKEKVVKKIKDETYKISLWQAFEWYFTHEHDKIKNKQEIEITESIRPDLLRIYPPNTVRVLTEPRYISDRDLWKKTAFKGLFDRVNDSTSPFWKYSEERNEVIKRYEHYNKYLNEDALTRIYVPGDPPPTYKDCLPQRYSKINDRHKLIIMKMEFIAPLYCLTQLSRLYEEYKKHLENFTAHGEDPVHADMRFYEEWKDYVLEKTPEAVRKESTNILIYILGLGTNKIVFKSPHPHSRDKDYYLVCEQQQTRKEERLGESLSNLFNNLANPTQTIKERMQYLIREELLILTKLLGDISIVKLTMNLDEEARIKNEINEILRRAQNNHNASQPRGAADRWVGELWEKINNEIERLSREISAAPLQSLENKLKEWKKMLKEYAKKVLNYKVD